MSPPALEIDALWSKMRPDRAGLVPAVVQELRTRRVLMVAWVSREALAQTFETGLATFWSRSRKELWQKGATSGHRQRVLHVRLDCDGDTLLYLVEAQGPACHEGYTSCFSWRRVGNGWRREPEDTDPPEVEVDADGRRRALGDAIVDTLRRPSTKRTPTSAIRVGAGIEHEARALANALQLKQRERAQEATLRLVAELVGALDAAGIDRLSAIAFEDATARQGAPFEPPPPGASALSRAWSSDPDPGARAADPPAGVPSPAPEPAGVGVAAPPDVDEWPG